MIKHTGIAIKRRFQQIKYKIIIFYKRILRIFKKRPIPLIVLNYKPMDVIINHHIQQNKYNTFVFFIRKIGIFMGYIALATIPIAIAVAIVLYGVHLVDSI